MNKYSRKKGDYIRGKASLNVGKEPLSNTMKP